MAFKILICCWSQNSRRYGKNGRPARRRKTNNERQLRRQIVSVTPRPRPRRHKLKMEDLIHKGLKVRHRHPTLPADRYNCHLLVTNQANTRPLLTTALRTISILLTTNNNRLHPTHPRVRCIVSTTARKRTTRACLFGKSTI
jgi:hypothetical protein